MGGSSCAFTAISGVKEAGSIDSVCIRGVFWVSLVNWECDVWLLAETKLGGTKASDVLRVSFEG